MPESRRAWLIPAVLLVFHLGLAIGFLRMGTLNEDEGWYLLAARLVSEGQVPWRDFAFFQAPLLPVVYGLAQPLFGVGIAEGRVLSLVLECCALLLAAGAAGRLGGWRAAAFVLAGMGLHPLVVGHAVLARPLALGSCLLAAGLFVISRGITPARAGLAALFLGLAAGARLSLLPALPALWLVILSQPRGRRIGSGAVAFVAGMGAFALACWPAFLASPGVSLFNLVLVHVSSGSHGIRNRLGLLSALLLVFGFLPLLVGVAARSLPRSVMQARWGHPALAFACLATIGITAVHFVPARLHLEHHAVTIPLLAVVASVLGADLLRRPPRLALLGVGAAMLVGMGAGLRRVPLDRSSLGQVAETGRGLASDCAPGKHLLTLHAALAVESGCDVPRGLEMGIFSYAPGFSASDLDRLHLMDDDRILDLMDDPTISSLALASGDFAHGATARPLSPAAQDLLRETILGLAHDRYLHEMEIPVFGQFGESLWVFSDPRSPGP